jgi:hypothetical protein
MEKLIARPRAGGNLRRRRAANRQRGDILLVVMVFLLVCLLGLVVSMREGIVSTLMGGNNLARQRDVQVSDIATRQVEGLMLASYGGMPLQISASTQAWLRMVPGGTAAPGATAGYWDNCLGNGDNTLRCGSVSPAVNSKDLGYTVLAVVQATGRSDTTSCQLASQTATFYDVFVHVKEGNGVTSSDTETVYRLCTS